MKMYDMFIYREVWGFITVSQDPTLCNASYTY